MKIYIVEGSSSSSLSSRMKEQHIDVWFMSMKKEGQWTCETLIKKKPHQTRRDVRFQGINRVV